MQKGVVSSAAIILIIVGAVVVFAFFYNSNKQSTSDAPASCNDNDIGNLYLKGACEDETGTYADSCSGSAVNEYSCVENRCVSSQTACPSGYICSSGACVQAFDFSISLSPSSSSIKTGQSVTSNVTVDLLRQPAKSVSLTVSGCPSSSICTFSLPNGFPPYTSKLSITTIATSPGAYEITVSGISEGKTQSVKYTLTVNP